jgi:hypothetical protein
MIKVGGKDKPIFSASSMRYAPQIKTFNAGGETHGEIFTLQA